LLQASEDRGKAHSLFVLGRTFGFWLSIRADSWPSGPFTIHSDVVPLHPSRRQNESLPGRRLAIQPKSKAVEAYYSEFLGLQKRSYRQTGAVKLPEKSYFLNFNHHFGRFQLKQDSKMLDFQSLLPGLESARKNRVWHFEFREERE
jgi:hypothetical protein